ncbi:MAG: hypothetical protein JF588_07500 [Caulobacterales bacterium]|nr:hypothetical protein [Caulobacterales bacterium]
MPSGAFYNHETIALDGEAFSSCEFRDCRLVYSGGAPPTFADCRFDGCDWRYDEAAARTLAHLKVVWNLGGKPSVQALIKDITVAR